MREADGRVSEVASMQGSRTAQSCAGLFFTQHSNLSQQTNAAKKSFKIHVALKSNKPKAPMSPPAWAMNYRIKGNTLGVHPANTSVILKKAAGSEVGSVEERLERLETIHKGRRDRRIGAR
jgi:hypothetical protein